MPKKTWYTMIGLFQACLLVFACTGPAKDDAQQSEIQRPVWPQTPEPARIEFVREITKPEDLNITPGFWSRIVSLFAGKADTRLIRPTAVVMTSDEVMYVADPGAKVVHRFDVRNRSHDMLRLEKDTFFSSPVSLAVDRNNRVYVADSALNRIFVIDKQATHAVPFDTSVGLDQPTGLAFDSTQQRLYVVNTRKHQVLAFDRQGQLLFDFGTRGAGAGEFNYPTLIWSDQKTGKLWVTDSLNFRIQHFTATGKFISKLASVGDATGNLARPKGVATDSFGHVYVMDALHNSMQIFNQGGDFLLYVGEQGRTIGQFWLPVGVYIDGSNRIFVADSFNNRVQVFRFLEDKG
jgi:DNA-binding beta-propeller fold protein YncE